VRLFALLITLCTVPALAQGRSVLDPVFSTCEGAVCYLRCSGNQTLSGSLTVTGTGAGSGFVCRTEGCRFQFGPDTYCYESGTTITCPFNAAFGTTVSVTVVTAGTGGNSVNLHPSAGINLYAQASGIVTINDGLSGTYSGSVPSQKSTNVTAVGNVGAGEDDLMTHAMTPGGLYTDGRILEFQAWGTAANNANAKTLKCYFGATAIINTALTTGQAGVWTVTGRIVRTSGTTQEAFAEMRNVGTVTVHDAEITAPAETLANAITVKCTGTGVANNDIVQEGLAVRLW
jgi:hypothetical protein